MAVIELVIGHPPANSGCFGFDRVIAHKTEPVIDDPDIAIKTADRLLHIGRGYIHSNGVIAMSNIIPTDQNIARNVIRTKECTVKISIWGFLARRDFTIMDHRPVKVTPDHVILNPVAIFDGDA